MSQLAIDGGAPAVKNPLRAFNSIGPEEIAAATNVLSRRSLSGFLGGQLHGGLYVETLENVWQETFGCKHAVAVNSATSGLLIASVAAGIGPYKEVLTTPFTMSATAAAPRFLGAQIVFGDVDPDTFNLTNPIGRKNCKAIIVTNLFGHPAALHGWRAVADATKCVLIEDNAQAIFAKKDDKYAGTIGHIGIFSLNVHKHLHCGEGGICVTDDSELALLLRMSRNHGELAGMGVGLNLRMTEIEAAIALAQLAKADKIMAGRIRFAEDLTHMVVSYPGMITPTVKEGCKHVYYIWPLKIGYSRGGCDRDWFVKALNAEGIPIKAGYVDPLYRLPAFAEFKSKCPVAEELHDTTLCTFEVCAYDPSREQMRQIKHGFEKVCEAYQRRNFNA